MKNNAIDYLIDLAEKGDCNAWLSYIIKFFIENKGIIDDNVKNDLADYLLQRKKIPNIVSPSNNFSTKNEKIILTKLEHLSGVNALSEEQSITFSPAMNIIYGLNGTGKSSYFRILNNMTGQMNSKNILQNIFSDSPKNIDVNIEYSIDDTQKSSAWSNTSTISDLRSIRVFDTEYTNKYLQKRNADELLIKPYALSYFSEISELIVKIKELSEEKIKSDEEALPDINLDKVTENFREFLKKDRFEEVDIKKIKSFESFSSEERSQLENVKKSIENLQKANSADAIKINKIKLDKLQKIKSEFKSLMILLEKEKKSVDNLVVRREKLRQEHSTARQQYELFSEIPGTDSDIWINFIKSGIIYCEEFELEDTCPYCHRSYDKKSLEITKAYSKFIKDTTQTQLDENTASIKEKIIELQAISVVDIQSEEIQLSLDQKSELITLNEQIIKNKESLLSKLREQEPIEAPKIQEELLNNLSKEIDDTNQLHIELNSEQSRRIESLKKYNHQLMILEEKESLNSQFTKLSKFADITNRLFQERKLISEINTSKLSNLSKKAHADLLTGDLLKSFEHNLKSLGLNNLSIKLQGSNSRGKQQTELILNNNKNIEDILSEGEQKATALALFISEITLSKNRSTIIFDDPVNSLDHRIMNKFSELLLSLENQIIIFTHNKMFLDSFMTSKLGHMCKNTNGGCNKDKGKHVYLYETVSEGKVRKGIIKLKQTENLNTYISDIKHSLTESPLSDNSKQLICGKLRRAVEFAIDEIILNNQVPTKYSNKKSRINWDELKKIENNSEIIDILHAIHGRCSGGALHNGTENEENPIDKDELITMLQDIEDIKNSH
ncbi:MAG: AAA family ATPase [Streptococcus sp.]|jgi:predicted ATPase, possibly involved in inorganic ion transport|uniref:AAA family ATPase n=1 Tax=Streptococcus oralis TaxID=1303 RepID=UPI00066A91E0|nr:AAA family ATPase [Streptococcus oralis]MDU8037527.1 AAA family ATPase [Streptococcus sp.]